MAQAALQAVENEGSVPAEGAQYLTFKLGDDVYAIDILNIKEIIGHGNLTAVPMMPEFIAGVINLRGAVVPVVNLAVRFGAAAGEVTKRTSIVIVEVGEVGGAGEDGAKTEMGIIVDAVNEVLDIRAADIEPAPAFGARIRADFIAGMGKVDGRFLILLDVNHVLSIDELSMVGEVRASAPPDGDPDAAAVVAD